MSGVGPVKRSSLLRSTALLAIAAVIPILLFVAISAAIGLQRERAAARDQAVAEAHRMAEAVDREIAASIEAVTGMADQLALDGDGDLDAFAASARRQQARHPLWLTVLLLDPQGRRMVNTRSPLQLGPVLEPASVAEVIRTQQPTIGVMTLGRQSYGLPIRAPVIRGGELKYIVTVVAAPDRFRDTLLRARLPPTWIATVVDRRGQVVARSHNEIQFLGKPASPGALRARQTGPNGVYQGRTLDGVDTLSAYWKSPVTGWSVHIGIPAHEFEAPLRRSLLMTGGGLAMSLLLAALFVFLLLRESELWRREAAATEQVQRLESLGRLTGGVAHDFNNLLMIIQGNADILGRRVKDPAAAGPLKAIRIATDRAAKITRELLVFARGGTARAEMLDLNAAVFNFLGALREAAGSDVSVELDLDPSSPWVELDRVQLEMALLNLTVNARDAMEGAGALTIATRVEPARDAGQSQVILSARDTGPGFDPADATRVFDPFFTTKGASGGSGLGLTQVYSFVQRAGGTVRIEQARGRGALVILTLPAAEPGAPPSPQAPPAHGFDLTRRRVLVADDNEAVRHVSAGFLRELGAVVSEAESGEAALRLLENQTFDLLVSDIVMPGAVDGLVLAREAAARWPTMPTLLISGYSTSAEDARTQGLPVLSKPYDMAELGAATGRLLKA